MMLLRSPYIELLLVALALLSASAVMSPVLLWQHLSTWLSAILDVGLTSSRMPAETLAKSRSELPDDARPHFHVGQVVRDKIRSARGIVVGWDLACMASESWRAQHTGFAQWSDRVHYTLAVHAEDAEGIDLENGSWGISDIYSPEPILESMDGVLVYGPSVPHHFAFYDSELKRYIPHEWLLKLYREDFDMHYWPQQDQDMNQVEHAPSGPTRTPGGQPLLRVVSYPIAGRLVAFGDEQIIGLGPGHFLVADARMKQEPFTQAVLLILRHDANFTQAVVVNRPFSKEQKHSQVQELKNMETWLQDRTQIPEYQELLIQTKALLGLAVRASTEARLGGDVGVSDRQAPLPDFMSVLHPFGEVRGASLLLGGTGEKSTPDLFLNGDLEHVHAAADRDAGAKVLLFRGYAGWGPQQLAGEIRHHGSWGLAAASVGEILRPGKRSKFWKRVHGSAAKGEDIAFTGH